jgi:hypothetical protein
MERRAGGRELTLEQARGTSLPKPLPFQG